MEILESAQYDSATDREMKRNNVCVARNVECLSLSPSIVPCPFSIPYPSLAAFTPAGNRGFVNIERLASTLPKWPTFS
ncbi:unnamed protein product, partial [Heterotrigona itama]